MELHFENINSQLVAISGTSMCLTGAPYSAWFIHSSYQSKCYFHCVQHPISSGFFFPLSLSIRWRIKLIKDICCFSFPLPSFCVHQMYNGTLKRNAAENKRYSSYSQMDSWGNRHYNKICSPTHAGSDYCFVQNMKSSRSEPDLYNDPPRGTLRRNQSGSRVSHKASLHRNSLYSNTWNNQEGITTLTRPNKRIPMRTPSCASANKQDAVYAQPVASKPDAVYRQDHSK